MKRLVIGALAASFLFVLPASAQNSSAFDATVNMKSSELPDPPVIAGDVSDRPYTVIGQITAGVRKATVFSKSSSPEKIYRELWERGQKMHADAVIHASYGKAHLSAMSYGQTNATGIAIKFDDGTAAEELMRAIAIAVLTVATPCLAQSPMVIGAPAGNVIHMGTSIQLETRDELTTEHKALKVGQQIEMDVLQPVMLGNQVAIPAGSRAVGEVTTVRNKGMWGKSGGITARVLYVEANGRQIRLNGSFNDRGETCTAGVVAAVAFVPVAGFFVTGTSAKIAPGTHVTAFIGEEVPVQFADGAAPAPAAPVLPQNAYAAGVAAGKAAATSSATVLTPAVATVVKN